MGFATGAIKYSLFIFNTLWTIVGILVILFAGLGWDAMPKQYAIGIIILGGVIILISFFGCTGAIRESARMMWTYAIFLLVILIMVTIFMCLSTRDAFKRYALYSVEEAWRLERTHPGFMDKYQSLYHCCGRDGANDYVRMARMIPSSCCKNQNCIHPLNQYLTGCLEKVEEDFADESSTTKNYGWGLLGLNLIIFILATVLALHFSNRKRRLNY